MFDSRALAEAVLNEITAFIARIEYRGQPDKPLAEKLAEHLARHPVPSIEELANVIEQAFWASLLSEESRPVRFRLVIHDEARTGHMLGTHEFARPMRLTPEFLKKCAVAHDPSTSFFAVSMSPQPAFVTGIGVERLKGQTTAEFAVEVTGNGSLEFSWGMWGLLRFSAGKVERLSDVPLPNEVYTKILQTVWGEDCVRLMLVLKEVVEAIERHGHGGSLWIVWDDPHESVSIKYPVVPTEEPSAMSTPPAPPEHCNRWSASIGEFSAADGAVVLNRYGQTLGFGAFVPVNDSREIIRVTSQTTHERVVVSDLGGGRHRSAATFVGFHRPSMAIVVSEDGATSYLVHADADSPPLFYPWSPLGRDLRFW